MPAWGTDAYLISVAVKMADLARAVQATHEVGVVHRDIKSSNILFDDKGRLWLTDFGLAHLGDEETFTRTGDVLGTYHYMSPEQALGNKSRVDARSDVYSLGATLYEFFSLRRPFHELALPRLLRAIAHEDPIPLRRYVRVPASLQAITAKAMEKSPDDRYATAAEFAEDLDRFAAGRKTEAESFSRLQRAARWLRRHKQTLAALFLIGAVALTGGLVGLELRAKRLREFEQGIASQKQRIDAARYALAVRSAHDALSLGDAAAAGAIVSEWLDSGGEYSPGVEWRHLEQSAMPPTPLQVIESGHGESRAIALFPDAERLATVGADGRLAVWNVKNGELVSRWKASPSPLSAVAVFPDGRQIAVEGEGRTVVLMDATTGAVASTFGPFRHHTESLAFSPNGEWLAIGIAYDPIVLYYLTTGESYSLASEARNETIRFSRDGSRLLSTSDPQEGDAHLLRVWAIGPPYPPNVIQSIESGSRSSPRYFAFSSDDSWIFAVDRHTAVASYFSCETGGLLSKIPALGEREAYSAAMSPDDRWCAVGLGSGNVRYWGIRPNSREDWRRSGESGSFLAHQGPVLDMKYQPVSGKMITAGADGLIKIWPTPRNDTFSAEREGLLFHCLEAGGNWLVAVRQVGDRVAASHFDLRDRTWRDTPLGESHSEFTLSPDRRALCAFGAGGSLAILSAADGAEVARDLQGEKTVMAAAFTPQGDLVAVGDQTGVVTLRSASDLHVQASLNIESRVRSLAFSPDGTLLACTDEAGRVHFIDARQWQVVKSFSVYSQSVAAAWRPESKTLFTGHFDGRILAWDAEKLENVRTLREHRESVDGLSFSPDGRTLYSASADGTIRVWQAKTGDSMGMLYRATNAEAVLTGIVNLGAGGLAALQVADGETSVLLWEWE